MDDTFEQLMKSRMSKYPNEKWVLLGANRPNSYREWIDGIKSRDYESILDEAFDKFWPEYQFKERGIVAVKDNVVYVVFK